MRLIDADKLPMYEVYKDDIDAAPTVDAEIVRHAKWDEQGYNDEDAGKWRRCGYKCSYCGTSTAVKSRGCAYCRSLMDAKE